MYPHDDIRCQLKSVDTSVSRLAAAYRHDDGAVCLYNAVSGTWYANDDGRVLLNPRPVCERDHAALSTGTAAEEPRVSLWRCENRFHDVARCIPTKHYGLPREEAQHRANLSARLCRPEGDE